LTFDINDLREQYAALSDDALLAVNPEELVPMAQECYRHEMQQRGLTHEAAAPAGSEGVLGESASAASEPKEEIVAVESYRNHEEATLAKSTLKAAGIPCALSNEYSGRFNLGSHKVEGGAFLLLVPESLLEDAQEVLASEISEEELAAQAEAAAMEEEEEPAEAAEEEQDTDERR
jgi:hypothetical protein